MPYWRIATTHLAERGITPSTIPESPLGRAEAVHASGMGERPRPYTGETTERGHAPRRLMRADVPTPSTYRARDSFAA
jgi:hypothetical protein